MIGSGTPKKHHRTSKSTERICTFESTFARLHVRFHTRRAFLWTALRAAPCCSGLPPQTHLPGCHQNDLGQTIGQRSSMKWVFDDGTPSILFVRMDPTIRMDLMMLISPTPWGPRLVQDSCPWLTHFIRSGLWESAWMVPKAKGQSWSHHSRIKPVQAPIRAEHQGGIWGQASDKPGASNTVTTAKPYTGFRLEIRSRCPI